MKHITCLIKPVSGLCDLRCRYCFYQDVSSNRQQKNMGFMTLDTARRLVESCVRAAGPGGSVHFLFQGGEPTLAGLEFFLNFLALEGECARSNRVEVSHAIQTNGMSMDARWADFFQRNGFLVGLSLDGTRSLHDSWRVGPGGGGSWDRAVKALSILDRAGVDANLLCVVTRDLARSPQRVYRSLRALGDHPLQFIPCLDPLEGERGEQPFSLTPKGYSAFLRGLFDCWYRDWTAGTYVSIRLFDDYLRLLMGTPPSSCAAAGACGSYLVAEGDGSLYPCDFYVLDKWRLGNIHQLSVEDALASLTARAFLAEGRRPAACGACRRLPLCRGGCKRDWVWSGPEPANYYCPAFQEFFDYALPRLQEVARRFPR